MASVGSPASPVRVLSRLFRRLFLQGLEAMHAGGELELFTDLANLKDPHEFRAYLAPLRRAEWVVYAKKPFAGPKQVLAYLARDTHRVAIANSRLIDLDETHVSFRWKDYRESGRRKSKVMRLSVGEFMRRFLIHVCRTASIAFATMASSPTATAPTSSRSVKLCSMCHPRRRIAITMMKMVPAFPTMNRPRALAAAAA